MTYNNDLQVKEVIVSTRKRFNVWHAVPRQLTMGLNGMQSSQVLERYYMYGSLLKFCVSCLFLFCGMKLFFYLGYVTASSPFSGLGFCLLFSSHCLQLYLTSCWSILPNTLIQLHSFCLLVILYYFLSRCSYLYCLVLQALIPPVLVLFSISVHLALVVFKAVSSIGVIKSKKGIRSMIVAKLKHLFSSLLRGR